MGQSGLNRKEGGSITSARHYCMLGFAAGLGILLAREGSMLPVNSRESADLVTAEKQILPPTIPTARPQDQLAVVEVSSSKATAGTHVPLPETDLDGVLRIDLNRIEMATQEILPVKGP